MKPIIDLMFYKNILAYCVQETWIVGNVNTVVKNHMIFRHNREEREVGTRGRVPGGVTIIFSPTAVTACRAAGPKSPITTPLQSKFVGRLLGLKLQFPRFHQFYRRVRGKLKMLIASIYHPVDPKEQEKFNDTLSMLVNSVPKSLNFIGGYDVNANLGVSKTLYKGVIGPFGIENRNMKGRRLLSVLSQNILRVTNSYFNKSSFVACLSLLIVGHCLEWLH